MLLDIMEKGFLTVGFVGMAAVLIGSLQMMGVYQIVGDGSLDSALLMMAAGLFVGWVSVGLFDSCERYKKERLKGSSLD